jgi:hypothetical protein
MVDLRLIHAALFLSLPIAGTAQTSSAPEPGQRFVGPQLPGAEGDRTRSTGSDSSLNLFLLADTVPANLQTSPTSGTESSDASPKPKPAPGTPLDKNGDPIPLERREPQRILGFMPNFRTVSGGAAAHPPGFKYNFVVATHQAFDYSSFIFLGLTSLSAEAINEHPALGKGIEGFGQYTWRGFLDKTDNTYLSAWFLPTLLREDTRYYALGAGHSIYIRPLYVISQQAVARTYGGHLTPNLAGLGGKALPRSSPATTIRPARARSGCSPPNSDTPSCATSPSPRCASSTRISPPTTCGRIRRSRPASPQNAPPCRPPRRHRPPRYPQNRRRPTASVSSWPSEHPLTMELPVR